MSRVALAGRRRTLRGEDHPTLADMRLIAIHAGRDLTEGDRPPMTTTQNPPDPLVQYGFTPREAAALRVLWDSRHIALWLESVPDHIHGSGGTVEDALDFKTHVIEEEATAYFFSHGFTGHQAAVVQADPAATHNLYHRSLPPAGVDPLDSNAPHDFIINVLRVSESPDEVDSFLHRYEQAAAGTPVVTVHGPDTIESLTDDIAKLAGEQPFPNISCRCP